MSTPEKNREAELRVGLRAVIKLAWPSSLTMLIFSGIQLWTLIVLKPMGDAAIAAFTTGNRMIWLSQSLLFAISAGTMAMMARSWGENERREAARVAQISSYLTILIGIVFWGLFYFFAEHMARVFLAEDEAVHQSTLFIRASSPWLAFVGLNFTLSTIFRAVNDVMIPLVGAIVQAIVFVPIVYCLAYGLYGFPELGIEGAAHALGIANIVSVVFFVIIWLTKQSRLPTVPLTSIFHARTTKLINIGTPAMIEQLALQGGLAWFLIIVGWYGTAEYSAYGIGVTILSVSFLVGFGFSTAASTIVGQSLGRGRPDLAISESWRAMWLSVFCMTILGGLVIIFRWELAASFSSSEEMTYYVVAFLWSLGLMQPLMAIEFTLSGALRGSGDTKSPLIITMIGLLVFRGTAGFTAHYFGLPVEWVYAAIVLDYIAKSTLYLGRFMSKRWLKGKDRENYLQIVSDKSRIENL